MTKDTNNQLSSYIALEEQDVISPLEVYWAKTSNLIL